ncbi:hypothetical protein [Kitasatospora purpeofusca]|uniref:hypothetical protein n=1 Tax=Kitasatospora purpeofusca TaxID=67352 RepID=UPI002258D119|nr:hypothetical protein [Kitasatospora purpeofusca]MCX4757005.1 hypothetical protein [Kitasatospora purpeofusca]WSR35229.1 hypothetical protein OG715_32285 [Kitasatospora purpeofusca]
MPRSDADRLRRRELHEAASGMAGPRLLPWTEDGRPCYLNTDGKGYISTLADGIETVQLGMGQELLEYARGILTPGAQAQSAIEYRWLARRLTEALSDALRVAQSRGERIPAHQEEAAKDGEPANASPLGGQEEG